MEQSGRSSRTGIKIETKDLSALPHGNDLQAASQQSVRKLISLISLIYATQCQSFKALKIKLMFIQTFLIKWSFHDDVCADS